MASKIRVLTEDTINKIAAGEVIENPASVVKELVENSIDAGSTEITIELNGGGRQLIRVSDNGSGMNRDDALLCLERHATSKIRAVEDLEGVMTMGFRGEAIPSIASISKFTLLTCPEGLATGTLIIIDGGKIVSVAGAVRSQGTTIEVKNLFFNVPVRKKFMKAPSADSNEVIKMVTQIALGNPSLKFSLVVDGKSELTTSRAPSEDFQEQLQKRIVDVLGKEFVDNSRYFAHVTEEFTIKGFVGMPLYSRHNRTGQWLFINGRGVVSPLIATAVRDGYGTCLPTGRYPVFVLDLLVTGELVDVNVHPQKREVRLRQEQLFREQIAKGIQDCIHKVESKVGVVMAPTVSPVFFNAVREPIPYEEPPRRVHEYSKKAPEPPLEYRKEPPVRIEPQMHFVEAPKAPKPAPKIIATLPGYILIEMNAVAIVDQKAAHCRVLYEKFAQALRGTPVMVQPLLVPHMIELLPNEAAQLRKLLPHLNALGLQVREFGPRTFVVDALPDVLSHENLDALILDALETEPGELSDPKILADYAKRLAIAMNRRAVSGKTRLSHVEASGLLEQLQACENSQVCPQGRPICVPLPPEEIAKFFQQSTLVKL